MSTPTSEISLHVQVTIDPKDVPAFVEAMTPIFDIVTAEPNCTFFEIYQSMEDPGTISWVENWNATVEWFMEVQIKKDYYKSYLEKTEPMFTKPRRVEFYKRTGSRFLMQKKENWDISKINIS